MIAFDIIIRLAIFYIPLISYFRLVMLFYWYSQGYAGNPIWLAIMGAVIFVLFIERV